MKRRFLRALSRLTLAAARRSYLSRIHPEARKILFVCKGNICRSCYAEEKLRMIRSDLEIRSAGLVTSDGLPANESAVRVASARGVSLTEHCTSRYDATLGVWADVIFVMDDENFRLLKVQDRESSRKMLPLGLLESHHPFIPDPYGRSEDIFHTCYDRIDRCLEILSGFLPR